VKVYIAVDSEGQACVVREKDPKTVYGIWQGEFIREQATREAAAAVIGARQAGATEILVHDSGFIRGFSPIGLFLHYDKLPSGVKIALGGVPMKLVLDSTFDAAILLGHHAMAGVQDGVLAHTFSSATIENMWLNGKRIGEIAVEALQIGTFGVPVVMVSADEAGCREAKEWLGDVEVAPTKRGLGIHWAISLHPEDACDLIRAKAREALGRLKEFKPYKLDPPFEFQTDFFTEEQARAYAQRKGEIPVGGREMVGTRSLLVRTNDPLDFI